MVTGPSPRKNWRLNKGARDYTVIAMKGLGIVLLSIASIAVLLVLILPVIFSQVLARYALRVDTHRFLVRPAILGSRGLETVAFLNGRTAVAHRVRLGNLEAQPLKSTLPVL